MAISALLESLVERGALRIEDMDYAAWQLANMAFGKFHTELLLGLVDQVPEAELDAHLRRAVDDFLRLYGNGVAGQPG